jgi:hypothetical protein
LDHSTIEEVCAVLGKLMPCQSISIWEEAKIVTLDLVFCFSNILF